MSKQTGSDGNRGPEQVLLTEFGYLIEPLATAAEAADAGDIGPLVDLLHEVGIGEALLDTEIRTIQDTVVDLVAAWNTIRTDLLESDQLLPPDKIDDIISAFGTVFTSLADLDGITVQTATVDDIGTAVLDHLLVTYLWNHHRGLHNVLVMVGVIRSPDDPAEIDLSSLPNVIEAPNDQFASVFGWGTNDFMGFAVLFYLKDVMWRVGVPSTFGEPNANEVSSLRKTADVGTPQSPLYVNVLTIDSNGSSSAAGIKLVPVPGANGRLPGLAVVPFGLAQTDVTQDLGGGWTFNASMSSQTGDWGLIVDPDGADIGPLPGGSTIGTFHGEASLEYDPSSADSERIVLLGRPDASRLALDSVSAKGTVDYDGTDASFAAELPTKGTIGAHPDDFDNFLGDVMPDDGIFYDFDATVGWSSTEGLYFERGGSLETSIPQNTTLGPVTLKEIYLAVTPDGQTVTLEGAASATLTIGPATATTRRMGVAADVSFPQDRSGDLGPIEVEQVGFKPPEGLGIDIDAGGVTGGGYIGFDPENNRYAGILDIQIGDISVTAVGLLTTELPGGGDGYSFLIMIAGEFSPVALGFGFTLNGVGGLFGLHRSLNVSPLRTAVRTGSMGQVLFPDDPVANATSIISRLRKTFPPTRDHYVFGPMVKIGWGTPTLITLDLGVILELPTWKIVVLGRMSAELPDEQAPMIVLNMDVLGVIRPAEKRVAVDATLYDSRVAQWAISGDMALRSKWGEDSRFVLSVGGFHPRFDPPKNFPDLDRVRLTLGNPGGNPSIEIRGYFAVTSNTVQVGAGVSVYLEAGPASISGNLAVDALFHFDPFKFVVDFMASLTIEAFGYTVSAGIDGSISGPTPYRVKGTAHVELSKLYTVDEQFNVTLGPTKEKEQLPAANVLAELQAALDDPGNWSAQRPAGGEQIVSLREIETTADEVLAHPLGEIAGRQTVVPLDDFHIEKFGNARPSPYTSFAITDATTKSATTSIAFGDHVREKFAPAQYTKMTDTEKLDSPGFETHVAGRRMTSTGVYAGWKQGSGKKADNIRSTRLTYEATYIDKELENYGSTPPSEGTVTHSDAQVAVITSTRALANADTKTTGTARFAPPPNDGRETQSRDTHAAPGQGPVESGAGPNRSADSAPAVDGPVDERSASDAVAPDGGTRSPDAAGGLAAALSVSESAYVIVSTDDHAEVALDTAPAGRTMSKVEARRALSRHLEAHPNDEGEYRVMAARRARSPTVAPITSEDEGPSDELPAAIERSPVADIAALEPVDLGIPPEEEAEAPPPDEPSVAEPSGRLDAALWSVERHARTTEHRLDDLAHAFEEADHVRSREIVDEAPTIETYATAIGRNTFELLARSLLKRTAEPRTHRESEFTTGAAERALDRLREQFQVLTTSVGAVAQDVRADDVGPDTHDELERATEAVAGLLAVVEELRETVDTDGETGGP